MSFGFELRMAPRLSVRMEMGHKLEMSQKITMKCDLIEAMHGAKVRLKYGCPSCSHQLTAEELLKGFTNDPLDTSTKCPNCDERFQPLLAFSVGTNSDGEIYFMCANQAKYRLEQKGDAFSRMMPDEIRKREPMMYYSVLFHFGTLKNAFAKISIDYSAMEVRDWEVRVRPFLGEMPDGIIAEVAGVSVSQIRNLRKRLKIPHFVNKGEEEE
jgi:hypothetical protein